MVTEADREGWGGSGDAVAFTFASIEVVQSQALFCHLKVLNHEAPKIGHYFNVGALDDMGPQGPHRAAVNKPPPTQSITEAAGPASY